MINIKAIIVSILNGDSRVTDIIGANKVIKNTPQNMADFPCVVYSVIGGTGDYAFGRQRVISNFSIQLDLYNSPNPDNRIKLTSLLSEVDDIMTENAFLQTTYLDNYNRASNVERITLRYSYLGVEE